MSRSIDQTGHHDKYAGGQANRQASRPLLVIKIHDILQELGHFDCARAVHINSPEERARLLLDGVYTRALQQLLQLVRGEAATGQRGHGQDEALQDLLLRQNLLHDGGDVAVHPLVAVLLHELEGERVAVVDLEAVGQNLHFRTEIEVLGLHWAAAVVGLQLGALQEDASLVPRVPDGWLANLESVVLKVHLENELPGLVRFL